MTPIKRTIRFLLSKIFFVMVFSANTTLTILFVIKDFFVVLEFYKQGLIRHMRRCHDHPLPCLEWATSLSSIKNFITTFTQSFFWKIQVVFVAHYEGEVDIFYPRHIRFIFPYIAPRKNFCRANFTRFISIRDIKKFVTQDV